MKRVLYISMAMGSRGWEIRGRNHGDPEDERVVVSVEIS
jgi:hypothetical protein